MGFTGTPDGRGVHIGYKMGTVTSNKLMKSDETKAFSGEIPAELCAGKHLIFISENIIEHQYVGDAKTTLLHVILNQQLFFQIQTIKTVIKHYTINFN